VARLLTSGLVLYVYNTSANVQHLNVIKEYIVFSSVTLSIVDPFFQNSFIIVIFLLLVKVSVMTDNSVNYYSKFSMVSSREGKPISRLSSYERP
jgi:hypothetical protein